LSSILIFSISISVNQTEEAGTSNTINPIKKTNGLLNTEMKKEEDTDIKGDRVCMTANIIAKGCS